MVLTLDNCTFLWVFFFLHAWAHRPLIPGCAHVLWPSLFQAKSFSDA